MKTTYTSWLLGTLLLLPLAAAAATATLIAKHSSTLLPRCRSVKLIQLSNSFRFRLFIAAA